MAAHLCRGKHHGETLAAAAGPLPWLTPPGCAVLVQVQSICTTALDSSGNPMQGMMGMTMQGQGMGAQNLAMCNQCQQTGTGLPSACCPAWWLGFRAH